MEFNLMYWLFWTLSSFPFISCSARSSSSPTSSTSTAHPSQNFKAEDIGFSALLVYSVLMFHDHEVQFGLQGVGWRWCWRFKAKLCGYTFANKLKFRLHSNQHFPSCQTQFSSLYPKFEILLSLSFELNYLGSYVAVPSSKRNYLRTEVQILQFAPSGPCILRLFWKMASSFFVLI